jgi:hypothetical protein
MANKKSKREMRNMRIQQIAFVTIGVIVILSMLISQLR